MLARSLSPCLWARCPRGSEVFPDRRWGRGSTRLCRCHRSLPPCAALVAPVGVSSFSLLAPSPGPVAFILARAPLPLRDRRLLPDPLGSLLLQSETILAPSRCLVSPAQEGSNRSFGDYFCLFVLAAIRIVGTIPCKCVLLSPLCCFFVNPEAF